MLETDQIKKTGSCIVLLAGDCIQSNKLCNKLQKTTQIFPSLGYNQIVIKLLDLDVAQSLPFGAECHSQS